MGTDRAVVARMAGVEFTKDADEVRVTFKGQGRRTDASIDPATGAVELTFESRGLMGRISDLHRGADSGNAWKWVIDAVAVLMVVGALTGLMMWWHIPRRRRLGVISLLLGVLAGASIFCSFLEALASFNRLVKVR